MTVAPSCSSLSPTSLGVVSGKTTVALTLSMRAAYAAASPVDARPCYESKHEKSTHIHIRSGGVDPSHQSS